MMYFIQRINDKHMGGINYPNWISSWEDAFFWMKVWFLPVAFSLGAGLMAAVALTMVVAVVYIVRWAGASTFWQALNSQPWARGWWSKNMEGDQPVVAVYEVSADGKQLTGVWGSDATEHEVDTRR